MSLFDKLKDTKLKSLKFGDKGTTGDSTKPYIVTDINTVDTPVNKFRLTKFDDGFIRGGAIGAANAGIVDTIRIGKFLTDFPKGPLFIAKQVGLQLSNPPLETKQLPVNRTGKGTFGKIIAGISNIANKINNLVGGPTRIYNLGINTLAQVPLNAVGGHIARHGFLPYLDNSQKYESVVTENNKNGNNRLEGLYYNFFYQNRSGTKLLSNVFKTVVSDSFGGAKSVYGIGRTTIHRTTFTGREFDINHAATKEVSRAIYQGVSEHVHNANTIYQKYRKKYDPKAKINDFKQSKIQYTVASSFISSAQKTNFGNIHIPAVEPTSSFRPFRKIKYDIKSEPSKAKPLNTKLDNSKLPDGASLSFNTSHQKTTKDLTTVKTEPTSSFRFKKLMYDGNFEPLNTEFNKSGSIKQPPISPKEHINAISSNDIKYKPSKSGVSSKLEKGVNDSVTSSRISPTTSNKKYNELKSNIVVKNSITYPNTKSTPGYGIQKKIRQDIDKIIIHRPQNSKDSSKYDYGVSGIKNIYKRIDDDILMITFTQIDPFDAKDLPKLDFSAYMSGYSENYDSSWDSIKYNGRSDFLYTFNSYKKTASFKLQVPIFDKADLIQKHTDLKTLQTGLAGKYLNNRLGGVLTKINLGYYLNSAVCIINSLNISIPAEATWDWGIKVGNEVLAYAMLLEANFQITIIDDKVPGFHETKKIEPSPTEPIPKSNPPKKPPTGGLPGIDKVKKENLLYRLFGIGPKDDFEFGGGDYGGGGAGDSGTSIGNYNIRK